MKYSVDWLRDWVDLSWDADTLSERLTMAGLEVDAIEPVVPACPAVVARLVAVRPHPQADKLRLCTIDVGAGSHFEVVCGAPNAREGLFAPYVPVGSRLPDGRLIEAVSIRGVESRGMLCSAAELGLGEAADGLLELDSDCQPGQSLTAVLALDDLVVEVGLTPNRGDCLSMLGLAREIAALSGHCLSSPTLPAVAPTSGEGPQVVLAAPDACSRYAGRIIRGVDATRPTPLWMKERLRRCGVRSISIVVDITNYVMLELGQPMHAFDLARINGGIRVRFATEGEPLTLLDGTTLKLPADALVIADDAVPLALAGVMGGQASGVDVATRDILLESAWFEPIGLSRTARRHGLHTDASHRFERGVDPAGQRRAIERATALVLECCGGAAGPVVDAIADQHAAEREPVDFRPARVAGLLGIDPGEDTIASIFNNLGFAFENRGESWRVAPPSWRPDLAREVDLVEEVARLVGYGEIPETLPRGTLAIGGANGAPSLARARDTLVALGYYEAVTFSFIPEEAHRAFAPDNDAVLLTNPIASDMSAMRPSLVPGLLAAVRFNRNRQQQDVRLFEHGMTFRRQADELIQKNHLAAIITGRVQPAQWGAPSQDADFYDLKQDLETVLAGLGLREFRYEVAVDPAYHPRQFARVFVGGQCVATIGALHPKTLQLMDVAGPVLAFEIAWDALGRAPTPGFEPLSRYPSVRRDLALVVDESIAADAVLDRVRRACGPTLRDLQLFDVYRGQGIDSGKKSLALGLIFQSASSTLTDTEIEDMVASVVQAVGRDLGGILRT